MKTLDITRKIVTQHPLGLESRMLLLGRIFPGLILLAACTRGEATPGPNPAGEEESAVRVRTVEAVPEEIPIEVAFTGTVVADKVVRVAPQIGGKVKVIHVREGEDVAAGQPLLEIDDSELNLRVAQAAKAYEAALKRIEQLEIAAEIEEKSVALGVKQAEEALAQVHARAQAVEKGARPQEREQVKALVDMAKTRMESMRREMERMRKLYESEVIPKQNFEQVEDGYKLAEAQYRQSLEQLNLVTIGARQEDRDAMEAAVRQATAAVEMARIAARRVETTKIEIEAAKLAVEQAKLARELAELGLGYATVTAPCAGRVEQVLVEEGAVVGPGVPVVVLVDTTKSEIVTLIREEDRIQITPGTAGSFEVDGLPGEGPFSGTVKHVGEMADPASGLFRVTIAPEAKAAPRIKGGMFVRGTFHLGTKAGALVVPLEAVLRAEGRKVLYVVQDGRAVKRYVETGLRYPTKVEITAGLAAGEHVVVSGQVGLMDGAAVTVEQ